MKRLKISLCRRICFCLCLLGAACGRLPDAGRLAAPEIIGIEATDISETEATLTASVRGAGRMAGVGFIYAKADDAGETSSAGPAAYAGETSSVGPAASGVSTRDAAAGTAQGSVTVRATLDGESFSARISGLEDGATYVFEAFADNGAGLQCRSGAGRFRTKARPAPDQPDNPNNPDNPDNPNNPDNPDQPDDPDQPDTPDTTSFIDLPDEHFRAWVLWNYDADRDGRLSAQEAAAIRVIELNTDETASLEGIQPFPALVKIHAEGSLNDGDPKGRLSALDLSGNPRLDMLYLPHNQITGLDLSPVPLLTRLEVPYNLLTSIEVSHLSHLNLLSLMANRLTSLDTRGLNGLDELHCDANPLTDLQLDNAVLRYLNCSGTLLTVLDLRKCPKLNELDCTGCPFLTTVRLSRGQVLGTLRKDDHTTLSYE